MSRSRVSFTLPTLATPAFASLAQLWSACLAAPAPASAGETASWESLTSAALGQLIQNFPPDPRAAFLLATTKANLPAQEAWMNAPAGPPPTLHAAAVQLAQSHGLTGPAWCVSAACASGLIALVDAALAIESGEIPAAVVLAADVAAPFIHDGFAALKSIAAGGCHPFDEARDGLVPNSAAAATRLAPADPANPNALVLAGWGIANDAVHMTAPDRQARGLIAAIHQALAHARIAAMDIDAVLAHGTGTRYNDAMEATAFQACFPHRPPITAIKGLLGHTFGAAGLAEVAVASKMLLTQTVPPVHGLACTAFPDLNLVTEKPLRTPLQYVLKTASGFGGINAAIILARYATAGGAS